MEQSNYRKYVLQNLTQEIYITVSNYEIPKNCSFYLLTNDIYVIGYKIKTDYGIKEMPVVDTIRGKKHAILMKDIRNHGIFFSLLKCGLPLPATRIIMTYID